MVLKLIKKDTQTQININIVYMNIFRKWLNYFLFDIQTSRSKYRLDFICTYISLKYSFEA